jgi:hypothetical protein
MEYEKGCNASHSCLDPGSFLKFQHISHEPNACTVFHRKNIWSNIQQTLGSELTAAVTSADIHQAWFGNPSLPKQVLDLCY